MLYVGQLQPRMQWHEPEKPHDKIYLEPNISDGNPIVEIQSIKLEVRESMFELHTIMGKRYISHKIHTSLHCRLQHNVVERSDTVVQSSISPDKIVRLGRGPQYRALLCPLVCDYSGRTVFAYSRLE